MPQFFLLPTTLGDTNLDHLSPLVIQHIHRLEVFIVERAKTARRFIKSTQPPYAIADLLIYEIDKHQPETDASVFREALAHGKDIGFLSEAGCPGIADPGARFVQLAHQKGMKVLPLVGPSSIVLALMASGLNGQHFCFQGYLPPQKAELAKALKRLEQISQRQKQTQLFIETPYRNQSLVEQTLKTLGPKTQLCIAADLTLPSQYILTQRVEQWRRTQLPDLHKRPTIFLLDASH
ncbi:MAG: SAM-dependent methyltransferase [Bacteroidota bacterium]